MFRNIVDRCRKSIRGAFSWLIGKAKVHKRLFIGLCTLMILMIGLGTYYSVVNKDVSSTDNCQQLNNNTQQTVHDAAGMDDFKKAYENLNTQSKSCESGAKFLGVGSETGADKVSQFQYYHARAVNGYRIGKTEEAKNDANKGLSLKDELTDSDKKGIAGYDQLVKDLEWVRDGNF